MRSPYTALISAGSKPPELKAPRNACDSHMHVFDPRFPPSPHWPRRPPVATVDDYRLTQGRIGTERVVVVTPSTYGTDNRCTLDAVAQFDASARAVIVVDTTITDTELKQYSELGVCGIRVNFVSPQSWGGTSPERLEELAARLHRINLPWHVQVFMRGAQIVEMEDLLNRLPVPLVIDHLAGIPLPSGLAHPAYHVVRTLLDRGNTWVKLSGAYIESRLGAPAYADVSAIARTLVSAAPERLVWGSDWPHTIAASAPDDAELFDLLADWIQDESIINMVLVSNPETLYGF